MIKIFSLFLIFNFFLLFIFINLKKKFYINDSPSNKKIHKNESYPIGGVFIFTNIILLFVLDYFNYFSFFDFLEINQEKKFIFFFLLFSFFLIGLLDDKFNLKPLIRLFLLAITTSIFLSFFDNYIINNIYFEKIGVLISLNEYSFLFTLISIIFLTQILNFFDGIDLQSGVYSIFVISYISISINLSILIFLLIPISFFLYLNRFHKIFLGDGGIYLLSFLISNLLIINYNNFNLTSEEVFLILLIPFLDFLRLFFERIKNQKNPMHGDLNHIHHIFLRKFSFYETLISIILLYTLPLLIYKILLNQFIFISALTIFLYFFLIYRFRDKFNF